MRTLMIPLAKLPAAAALACLLVSPSGSAIEIEQRALTTSSAPAPAPAPAAQAKPAPLAKVSAPAATAVVPQLKASAQVTNPAWDMFQQIEEMRVTVAKLQGTVEEQQQLIERLQSDLRTRYTDLDQRLEQLVKPAVTTETIAPSAIAVAATAPIAAAVTSNIESSAINTVIPAKANTELTPEEIERQKTAYLAAYQSFRRDGAAPAITAMSKFLDTYPDSVFAPNAYYWLGEFQLALTPANYATAEANFRRVLRDYSASPKVASAYYKLGSIADLQGNRTDARDWMTKLLAQFPSSPEARLAQSFLDQNPAK
ncbi:MAG: tetratricopeptide repeat protein [Pseudomonadota bacterium]